MTDITQWLRSSARTFEASELFETADWLRDQANEISELREAARQVTSHCGPINKGLEVDYIPVSLSDWRKLKRAVKKLEELDDGQ